MLRDWWTFRHLPSLLEGDNPVRVWREYRGISAADLGRACGVTAAAISQIESGKRMSSVMVLKKIARHLKIDLDTLALTDDDSQQTSISA